MHVLAADEDLLEHRLVGDVGQDAQLDLRVVGADEHVAGRGLEAAADLAAQLGAHRDVLHVRVRRGQPAGRRGRPARRWCGCATRASVELRQDVEVGLHELVELAPALDLGDDRVLVADRLQHARVGREAGLAAALARQAELVEQDRAELLGRADGELLAGQLPDLALEVGDLVAHARADLAEALLVEPHAGDLHVAQHARRAAARPRPSAASRPRSSSCSRCQAASACARAAASAASGSAASAASPRSSQISREREAAARGLEQVGGQQRVVGEVGAGPRPAPWRRGR